MTILGDDRVATAAAALGIAHAQAQHRRVWLFDLLGDGSPLASLVSGDDAHGVSDMVQFGISLRRVARPLAATPNLSIVPGGAESPLSEEVLESSVWDKLFEQVKQGPGLLLVAAPSRVPSIGRVAALGDGAVLVGEGAALPPHTRVLAEVRRPATRPAAAPAGAGTARGAAPERRRSMLPLALLALLVAGGALLFPRWRALTGRTAAPDAATASDSGAGGASDAAAAAGAEFAPGAAAFGVQLYFLNSEADAQASLLRSADSLPAVTYAIVRQPGDSANWFRLVAGAFPDSVSAESFLGFVRDRGVLSTGAGRVVRAPFALLLDSAQSEGLAGVRRSAFQGRGIPAYALRDSVGLWRIYAGAFSSQDESALLKQRLDSLNIQSVLVTRTGSGS